MASGGAGAGGGAARVQLPLQDGAYTIRLADAAHGAPSGGFLSCTNTTGHARDSRTSDSVYVHASGKDLGGIEWRLQADGDAYTIRLADAAHGAPSEGFLSCHNTEVSDPRGDDSAYVHVNSADYGTRWRLEADGDAYTIRLVDAENGAPTEGFLSCHSTVDADPRGDDSVYVHVNSTDYGSTKWHIAVRGTPAAPPVVRGLPAAYPRGRGLALLFAAEWTYVAEPPRACVPQIENSALLRQELDVALRAHGFDTMLFFAGDDVLGDVRAALAGAAADEGLACVVVAYSGHGGMHHGQQILGAQEPVRAEELEALVNSSVRAGVPKLFILDCCSSDCGSPLSDWTVDAGGESVHDVAVYHAASAGRYGTDYITGTRLGGLSQCFADAIMRNDGIELNEARLVANAELRRNVPRAEPALDNRLDRPLVFWRAAVPGVRLRADPTPSGMSDGESLGLFFGPCVGPSGDACLPVEHVFRSGGPGGEAVFSVRDGEHLKMVTQGGEARHCAADAEFGQATWDAATPSGSGTYYASSPLRIGGECCTGHIFGLNTARVARMFALFDGRTVAAARDGVHTKMVASDGEARYYESDCEDATDADVAHWESAKVVPGWYKRLP